MRKIDKFLAFAVQKKASDLHFVSSEPVRLRIDGDLVPLENSDIPPKELQDLFFEILTPQERDRFLHQKNLDKSLFVPEVGHFRMNLFLTRKGIAGVFRTIPVHVPTIDELGLPPVIKQLCDSPKGLVLLTGPTGSGKSTTLAAMIDHLNSHQPLHILTVEDPIEFVHTSKHSLVNQREIGATCNSFADALKYSLREDPDVILIGELRDLETISLALTAAETGHLVLATLHTRGAGASVDRIIDSFPSSQQAMIRTMLSESLTAVISQALLKRASGEGRIAAYEIMVVNHAISNLIREGKVFQIDGVIQTARKEGMVLMDQSIMELVNSKQVTLKEAEPYLQNVAFDRNRMSSASKNSPQGFASNTAAQMDYRMKSANANPTPSPAKPPPFSGQAKLNPMAQISPNSDSSIHLKSPPEPVKSLKPLASGKGENTVVSPITDLTAQVLDEDADDLEIGIDLKPSVGRISPSEGTSVVPPPQKTKIPIPPPLKKKTG